MPVIDTGWQSWLAENTQRGCSPGSMIQSMMSAGFDATTASANVLMYMNGGSHVMNGATNLAPAAAVANQYVYDQCPIAESNRIFAYDREVSVINRCQRPQIVVFSDLLTAEECDEIVLLSQGKLRRSTTVNPTTGQDEVIDDRSSEGTSFQRGENPLVERIEKRLAALVNYPVDNGEGLQILHYNYGGEYKPHFDYFPPSDPGSAVHMVPAGQRVATIIMYLNDVDEGGETIFPEVTMSVTPRKGSAVYFRYFNHLGQIDPLTLHGGAPVLKGEKWIMTKWLRERRY